MISKLTKERIEWLNYAATRLAANGTEMAMSPQDVIALSEYEAAMDSEPAGKPFMYGIADPDGNAYIDELCVSEDLGLVEDTVNELNYDREEGDELNYSVVALYRHAQQPVVPDEMLCDFYEVNNWPDLVRELVKHVEQLQDSAKRNVKPWEDTFPETLLPAYIERVKQADEACRAELAGNSPVIPDGSAVAALNGIPMIPDGYVMVPMRLTAENGAKGVLSGEFSETKFVNCPECFGDDECETCDGSGRIEITVPVTWTTIKEIWAKGVEHFAAAPQEVKGE